MLNEPVRQQYKMEVLFWFKWVFLLHYDTFSMASEGACMLNWCDVNMVYVWDQDKVTRAFLK